MVKTVAIDIDEVLAESGKAWKTWLEEQTSIKVLSSSNQYDLTIYLKEELKEAGLDGFEFWKSSNPYEDVAPVEYSIAACNSLRSMGYRLVPVSKIYTEHTCSKRKWLNTHFPMLEPPIYISMNGCKSDVRCDYIIDDRMENMKGFDKPTKGIIYNTPYLQRCAVDIPHMFVDNWGQIVEYFKMQEEDNG